MTMRKRLLSLLLAISMFATMMAGMTFSVFAEDSTLDAWSGSAIVSATDGWSYAALTEKVMPDANGDIVIKGYLNGEAGAGGLSGFGGSVALVPQVYVDKVGTAPTDAWWEEVPVEVKMRGWGQNDLQWYRGLGGASDSAQDSILDTEGNILKDIPVTIYIDTNAYSGNYHQIKMEAELSDGLWTTNWQDMHKNDADIDGDGVAESLSLVDGIAGFIVFAEGGSLSFSAEPQYVPAKSFESWSDDAVVSATDGWDYAELENNVMPDANGDIVIKGYLNGEAGAGGLSGFGGSVALVPQVYVDKVGKAPTDAWWEEVPVEVKMRGWGQNDLQWYRGLGGASDSAPDSILDAEGNILKDIPVTIYIDTDAYSGNYHQIKMEAELSDGLWTTNWQDMHKNDADVDGDGVAESLSLVDGVAGFIVFAEGGSLSFSAEPLYAPEEPADQIESWSGDAVVSATDGWAYAEIENKLLPDADGLITVKGYLNGEAGEGGLPGFGGSVALVPQVYVDKVGKAPTDAWWEEVPVEVKMRGWNLNDLQWYRGLGGASNSAPDSILDAEGNILKDIPVTMYIDTDAYSGNYHQIKLEAELADGLWTTNWQDMHKNDADVDGDGVAESLSLVDGVAGIIVFAEGGSLSFSAEPLYQEEESGVIESWSGNASVSATNGWGYAELTEKIMPDADGLITVKGYLNGEAGEGGLPGFGGCVQLLPVTYVEKVGVAPTEAWWETVPVEVKMRGWNLNDLQWYRGLGGASNSAPDSILDAEGNILKDIPITIYIDTDAYSGNYHQIKLEAELADGLWTTNWQDMHMNEGDLDGDGVAESFSLVDGVAAIAVFAEGGTLSFSAGDASQGGGNEPDTDEDGYFDDDFEDFDNGSFYIRSAKVPTFHNTAYQLHKALRATTDRTSLSFKVKVDEGATEGYISFIPQDRVLSGGATRMTAIKITDTNFEVRNGDDYEDVGVAVVAGQEYLIEVSFDFVNFTYSVSIDGEVVADAFAFNRGVGNDLRADDEGRGFGTDPDNIGIIGICSPNSEGFDMYDISVGIDNLVDNMELKGLVEENNPAVNADGSKTYYVGPTRKWQKVQDVLVLLQPGDTVEIAGDQTYPAPIQLHPSNGLANGTADKPITIKGVEVNGKKPEIVSAGAYQLVENSAEYWIVDGLRIQGHLPRACQIRGLDLDTLMSDKINEEWISFRGGYYSGGDNFTMRNCEITGNYQGFQCASPGNLLFEYNEVWGNGTNPYGHNMYLASRDGAVARIQYNYIHATAVPENNGLKTRAWRNEVYYNYFYNCPQAFELISMGNDAVRNSDVVGNVIVSDSTAANQGFRLGGDGTGPGTQGHYRLANNTFAFLSPEVAYIGRVFMAIDSVEMYNNIFYAAAPGSTLLADMGANWVHGRQVYGENNFVSDNITVDVPEEFVNTFTGRDPGFVNAKEMDFRLTATSPLVGAGVPFTTLKTWAEGEQVPDILTVLDRQPVDPFTGELVSESRTEKLLPDLGAFGLELDENYIGAAVSTEAVVDYPTDIVYDVTLSPVTGLNVLALSFKYDPADITFKSIDLGNELLEEFYCELDEETGVINALYVVKEETITTEENEIFATLTFEPTDAEALESYDGSDLEATLELTHFAASGMQDDGENSVQYDTAIEVDTATALVRGASRYDVNGDGKIDLADLSMMARHFNSTEAPNCDLVKDGIVDVADLVAMVSAIREVNPSLLP